MTSGFRHDLKAGGNLDNFRGSSKVFTWRDRKDCRNPQSGHQVPKTLRNNTHNTTTFSTQTRTYLRPLYYGRQSCRRLVCQRRGIRRKQLRAFIRSTDCVKSTVDSVTVAFLFARDSRITQQHVSLPRVIVSIVTRSIYTWVVTTNLWIELYLA